MLTWLVSAWVFHGAAPAGRPLLHSVAVLPLTNLAREDSEDYFADGMTEELITQLARIGSFRVISRTSVMRYKKTRRPLSEIAQELQADALVEGAIRRSGDHVRITIQLVSTAPERHLWAEAYDGDIHDVLKLQRDVAHDIAGEIRIKFC
jgi:TolB-like protein